MSDTALLDLGDELVVRVSGYPVGKAQVTAFQDDHAVATLLDSEGQPTEVTFILPLDVKDYDTVDGVSHHSTPLTGNPGAEQFDAPEDKWLGTSH